MNTSFDSMNAYDTIRNTQLQLRRVATVTDTYCMMNAGLLHWVSTVLLHRVSSSVARWRQGCSTEWAAVLPDDDRVVILSEDHCSQLFRNKSLPIIFVCYHSRSSDCQRWKRLAGCWHSRFCRKRMSAIWKWLLHRWPCLPCRVHCLSTLLCTISLPGALSGQNRLVRIANLKDIEINESH